MLEKSIGGRIRCISPCRCRYKYQARTWVVWALATRAANAIGRPLDQMKIHIVQFCPRLNFDGIGIAVSYALGLDSQRQTSLAPRCAGPQEVGSGTGTSRRQRGR